MATSFDVFYLGVLPDFDTIEGNSNAEGGDALIGMSFGGPDQPIYEAIQSWSPGTTGFSGGAKPDAYDPGTQFDTFSINGGPDQVFDMAMAYTAILTFADGTTASVTLGLAQDINGNTYILPAHSWDANQAAMESKPLVTITLTGSIYGPDGTGWAAYGDRYDADYYHGFVDGTSGDDLLVTDGWADGDGDQIDGVDGTDDTVLGYGGNDEIDALAGNDTIYGGTGDDVIWGGAGNDQLYGESDADVFVMLDTDGTDSIAGGEGGTDFDGIEFYDDSVAQGVTVTFSGDEAGSYDFDGTAAAGSFAEIEAIHGTDYADQIDASASGADQVLEGNGGADTITGGAGNDQIDGGTGDDLLAGGLGDDTFFYGAGDGADTITDFNAGNSGTLTDGNASNNDFIDLSRFYDDIWELYADQADDGILNQSNDGVDGVDYSDNDSFGSGSLTFVGASADPGSFTVENTNVACYLAGTRIATPRGPVVIEELAVGDRVRTRDHGAQEVRWIGCSELNATPDLAPVRIAKGALGQGLPKRDLLVSPQHRMLVRSRIVERMTGVPESLVAAVKLVGYPGITRAPVGGKLRYLHLMCAAHEVIYAEGAPSETLLPGPEAREAMSPEAWAELMAVFPDFDERLAGVLPARLIPGPRQQRRLAQRHQANKVALLEPAGRG